VFIRLAGGDYNRCFRKSKRPRPYSQRAQTHQNDSGLLSPGDSSIVPAYFLSPLLRGARLPPNVYSQTNQENIRFVFSGNRSKPSLLPYFVAMIAAGGYVGRI
jgi:hypothetical protein